MKLKTKKQLFRSFLPFRSWFRELNRQTVRYDLIAGLTGAVIVVPQGIAFASIAGLPPAYGLYTAIIPTIIAAMFGSSRHLISGPTTAISIVVFSTLSPFTEPGTPLYIQWALTLTFLAGLFQLALGVARMGILINFISHAVVVGFTSGAALLIAINQLKPFFGIMTSDNSIDFLTTLLYMARHLTESDPRVLAVGATTLITALLFQKFLPKWPHLLIAMIAGSLLAQGIDPEHHFIQRVGAIPATLPSFSTPSFSFQTIQQLTPVALAIALLGLMEAVSIARSVALRSRQTIHGNQEFIGQGLSNIIGSFFSSYAASGSFTRTGVNYRAGARTPMAAVFAAISLTVILLLAAPLATYLPVSATAGILLLVAYNLIDIQQIRTILRASKAETSVLLTTFGATLLIALEFAVYAGVMLSLVFYLQRTAHPRVVRMVPDPEGVRHLVQVDQRPPLSECPQLKIVSINGSLFFGATQSVSLALRAMDRDHPGQKHLLIRGSGINFIDLAGAEMLLQETERRRARGGGLYLYGVKDPVCGMFQSSGAIQEIGKESVFPSLGKAIQTIYAILDRDQCAQCQTRIFRECH